MSIQAPLEEVYNFWANYRDLPAVHDPHSGGPLNLPGTVGRTGSPKGQPVRPWRGSRDYPYEPNRLLAWRSTPGSVHRELRGSSTSPRTLTAAPRIYYGGRTNPPAGAVGHAVAWLLGRDLKTELEGNIFVAPAQVTA